MAKQSRIFAAAGILIGILYVASSVYERYTPSTDGQALDSSPMVSPSTSKQALSASSHQDYGWDLCADVVRPDLGRMASSPFRVPLRVDEDQFTVVMLTHGEKRIQTMLHLLKHLSQMKRIHKIILLWNNQGLEPPEDIKNITFRMPLVVKPLLENKLRLRFHPYNEIETQGVFSTDDDLLVQEEDMDAAFDAWKKHAYGLTGFRDNSRSHSLIPNKTNSYRYRLNRHKYSMVLTGAAFLHKEYLRLFTETLPQKIRNLIDSSFNCEDIAMNLLVANHSGANAALHVLEKTPLEHLANRPGEGLGKRRGHVDQRSRCIDTIGSYFDTLPLKSTVCVL